MLFSLKSDRFHVQSKFSWSFAKCIHYSCGCGQTLSSELLRKDIIIIIRKCLSEVFVVHCVPESNMNSKIALRKPIIHNLDSKSHFVDMGRTWELLFWQNSSWGHLIWGSIERGFYLGLWRNEVDKLGFMSPLIWAGFDVCWLAPSGLMPRRNVI